MEYFSRIIRGVRTAKGVFRARCIGKNTLKVIELFPTFACQLNCSMCSVNRYPKTDELTLDKYEEIAVEGKRLGAHSLTLLGGEPLLYKHIDKLITIFVKHHYYVHLVSNGLKIDKNNLSHLKECGLKCIFFSLESMDEAYNDSIRGKDHYARTMNNIDIAKSMDLRVGLATVIFPENIEHAVGVVNFCKANGLYASGGQVAPVGGAKDSAVLSDDELKLVRSVIKQNPHLTYDWMVSYFGRHRCPAGKEEIGITCQGDVIGCSYHPISFGNINHESLRSVWRRMQEFSHFKKDYPGCLCSEDKDYINQYLKPVADNPVYPVSYTKHPCMTKDIEPDMYRKFG
jgi:MoaA/NifB/PqqE/SkfB family radical SAM enzyme